MKNGIRIPNNRFQAPEEWSVWAKEHRGQIGGYSFCGRPIYCMKRGEGAKKILIWSQMHGNESTGLRAMKSLWDEWEQSNTVKKWSLHNSTIFWIPQLNPDGAAAWTRVNAQGIDLNRDIRSCLSPEMRAFKQLLNRIKPDYALNLHDQRTTFDAGQSGKGASLSLAIPQVHPESLNAEGHHLQRSRMREITATALHKLSDYQRDGMAVFDEKYYPQATGEWMQERGVACILIESGVLDLDFARNNSVIQLREFLGTFLQQLNDLPTNFSPHSDGTQSLWPLPANEEGLSDILFSKLQFTCHETPTANWSADLSIRLHEDLFNDEIVYYPVVESVGDLKHKCARLLVQGAQVHYNAVRNPIKTGEICPFWDQLIKHTPWESI